MDLDGARWAGIRRKSDGRSMVVRIETVVDNVFVFNWAFGEPIKTRNNFYQTIALLEDEFDVEWNERIITEVTRWNGWGLEVQYQRRYRTEEELDDGSTDREESDLEGQTGTDVEESDLED